ncbi:LysR family transcriptional regulator [Paraburkholderia sp. BL21I4N1]|uniref:LysR family transcriptional regulator n=1 Tax=Paraburkholderia sp. BL21I4N1 TaxID=1938801 RepID=UPI000CFB5125|nr:LysR family transcriptional regulator [Paraburkholderia sp. BL21I4N1]PQV44445.1 LysR family transcriptional regulator [Paraburkholderia sp. BL21I4N1]
MNSDITDGSNTQPTTRVLPSLQALVCFEAAARLESFSRAAQSLHVTHGAVSRAVRVLEDDLGVQLFARRNRRVFLSPDGQRLAEAVRQSFDRIGAVCREFRERAGETVLTLSCEPTLMMRWLIPNMTSLQAQSPQLELRLVAASGPALGEGIDMAIRRNDVQWSVDVEATCLFTERVGPVCRPEYAPDFFDAADDGWRLKDAAPLLHTRTRPNAWQTWAKLTSCTGNAALAAGKSFEHFYFSLQAAAAGVGVAIGPWQLVRREIESGLLAAPMAFVEDGSAYYLLARTPIEESNVGRVVRDWLLNLASG